MKRTTKTPADFFIGRLRSADRVRHMRTVRYRAGLCTTCGKNPRQRGSCSCAGCKAAARDRYRERKEGVG